ISRKCSCRLRSTPACRPPIPGSRRPRTKRERPKRRQLGESPVEQALGVLLIQLPPARSVDLERVENLDRLAAVHGSPFGVERRIRRDHPLAESKELQTAFGRRPAAEDRRVRPEHLEVVEGTLRQRLAQSLVVLVGGPRPELIEPGTDPPFEVWN